MSATISTPQSSRGCQGKSRSVSIERLPRAFQLSEEVLAQKAADAYKFNPAYVAIEKKTLEAICPFVDLEKKHVLGSQESEGATPDSPTEARTYTHGQEPAAILSSHGPASARGSIARDRTSSVSSLSYEDFRSHVRTTSSMQHSSDSGSPLRIHSQSSPLVNNTGRRNSMARNTQEVPYSLSSPSMPFNIFGQNPLTYQAMNPAYGLESLNSQQMKVLEGRLRSMSTSSVRSRRDSLTSSVAMLHPVAMLTLTSFVYESVRMFSPSTHELDEKLRLKQDFENILQAIQPTANLVVFGSVKNCLNLANADLDLMVVDDSSPEEHLHDIQVDLPHLFAEALRGQGYCVKLLAKTRIPLIKIQRDYVGGTFSCDICFDTPLALHNTRLIATYAACDPRVPILMMFVKLWARAKKINDAFGGTLKSYGYMLLLIYYLQNKVTPAVLPNLQMIASTGRPVKVSELECQGYDCWFSKDVSKVPLLQKNTNSVGELLEGFLSHFAHEFDYRDWVVSIRMPQGLQTKDVKNWTQLVEHLNDNGSAKVKDRYILSIEDPFETSHNVARTVTRAGLYDIRGEFMKAVRNIRSERLSEIIEPNL